MSKWGKTDLKKVSRFVNVGKNFLQRIEIDVGIPKTIRLTGDPILLATHWVRIETESGNSFKIPINCARWFPDELTFDDNEECCLDDPNDLPEGCAYDQDGDENPGISMFSLAIDRDKQESGQDPFGAIRLPYGQYADIERFAQTPEWGPPSDEIEGYDLTFTKILPRGGGFMRWEKPIPSRTSTPLNDDEMGWEEYIEQFEESYRYMNSGEIEEFVEGIQTREAESTEFNFSDEDESDEDEEDKPPKSKTRKKASISSKSPKKKKTTKLGTKQKGKSKKRSTTKKRKRSIMKEVNDILNDEDEDDELF